MGIRPRLIAAFLILLTGPGSLAGQEIVPLIDADQWITAPVLVEGAQAPLRFIVDTGAGVSGVSQSTADRLGLPVVATSEVLGVSGPVTMSWVELPGFQLGPVAMPSVRVLVLPDLVLTPFRGEREGYEPFDGVIGAEVLGRFDVVVSIPERALKLYEPGGMTEEEIGRAFGAPIPLDAEPFPHLRHEVHVNGSPARAVVDTGARFVVLNTMAARAAGVVPDSSTAREQTFGAGAATALVMDAVAAELTFGGVTLRDVPVQVADLPIFSATGQDSTPTLLMGVPVLRGCALFVSYDTRTVRYCRR